MSLETIIAPFKKVDEAILCQYTKFSEWYAGTRINKELDKRFLPLISAAGSCLAAVTAGITIQALSSKIHPHELSYDSLPEKVLGIGGWASHFLGIQIASALNTIYLALPYNKQDASANEKAVDIRDVIFKKMIRAIRLPMLMVGGYLVYEGFKDSGVENYDPMIISGIHALIDFGFSSSLYLMDTDPKLLDKKPFWNKANEWIKEQAGKIKGKLGELAPEPQPLPQPSYSTLENYILS